MSLCSRLHVQPLLRGISPPSRRPGFRRISSPAYALSKRLASSARTLSPDSLPFWQCQHTWNRAAANTFRCLIGCSIGDLTTMWYLMTYHPTVAAGSAMALSMSAGISTSILLETALLRYGKDRLPWKLVARTACGMSLVSMLAMEFTENVVTIGLSDASMNVSSGHVWLVTGLSMLSGFLTPLPYNYWRLKLYGRACH